MFSLDNLAIISEQLTKMNDESYFQDRKLLCNKIIARTWGVVEKSPLKTIKRCQ